MNIEYLPMDKDIKQEVKSDPDDSPPQTSIPPKGLKAYFRNFMHIGNILQSFIGSSILTLPFYNMQVKLKDRTVASALRISHHRRINIFLSAPAS